MKDKYFKFTVLLVYNMIIQYDKVYFLSKAKNYVCLFVINLSVYKILI